MNLNAETKTTIANMVKTPKWLKRDQLAIYERGRGVQSTRTSTRDLRISGTAP